MIHETAVIHETAALNVGRLRIGRSVQIGENVRIDADELVLGDEAVVGPRCRIDAGNVHLGWRTTLERDIAISAIGGSAETFQLGDACFLGFGITFALPVFSAGDYVTIHNSTLVNGYAPCRLGHNCWVGQQSILNSTAPLTLGDNVRVSTQCQLWTHVASGEVLEGCTLYGADPLVLEDDVWIMSGAIVSPNLVLRKRSVIATGAVMTRDAESEHCYGGVPAVDITDKIRPYRTVTLDDKVALMAGFVDEFHDATNNAYRDQVHLVPGSPRVPEDMQRDRDVVVISTDGDLADLGPRVTTLDLASKRYLKRRTDLEHRFLRFHVGHRARFIPVEPAQSAVQ